MKLMMYIGNDFIEAINLDIERISKPGYVGQFKRNLKIKHKELIEEKNDKLDFLVVPPAKTKSQAA
ncbi:MAG: hypothetical protein ABIP79_09410 [Chitinophagaceae bacterium]